MKSFDLANSQYHLINISWLRSVLRRFVLLSSISKGRYGREYWQYLKKDTNIVSCTNRKS